MSGVTIAALPLIRRLRLAKTTIRLKDGTVLEADAGEPLVGIFEEVWVSKFYDQVPVVVDEGEAIVDIGAHVGVFSVWAARHYPRAKIVCVEPDSRTRSFLEKNLGRNGIDANVVAAACAGRCQPVVLFSRGAGALNSLYPRDAYGSDFSQLAEVQATTLDNILEQFDIRVCALLKLDCEGAEYEILFAASEETLRKIRAIVLEYHVGMNGHTPAELAEYLEYRGFRTRCGPMLDAEGGYLYAWREAV